MSSLRFVLFASLAFVFACPSDPTASDAGPADAGSDGGLDAAVDGGRDADTPSDASGPDAGDAMVGEVDFTLEILFAGDAESRVEVLNEAPRFAAMVDHFRANPAADGSLLLAVGDNWMPGPFFFAGDGTVPAYDALVGLPRAGGADVVLLDALGVDASALGHHEFDPGLGVFDVLLRGEEEGERRRRALGFPYLACNVAFRGDFGPLATREVLDLATATDRSLVAPAAILTRGGERVGIVGVSTPYLAELTAEPEENLVLSPALRGGEYALSELAALVQFEIDRLTEAGVDKILLLSHMGGLEADEALIGELRDVDVVIAGGAGSLLAPAGASLRVDDTAAGDFPLWFEDTSGAAIPLVATDSEWTYLGRLVVGFDDTGRVVRDSIDPNESRPFPTDQDSLTRGYLGPEGPTGQIATDGPRASRVRALTGAMRELIAIFHETTVGVSDSFLDGREFMLTREETTLGDVVADSFLWYARGFDPSVAAALVDSGSILGSLGQFVVPPGARSRADAFLEPSPMVPYGEADGLALVQPRGGVTLYAIQRLFWAEQELVIVELERSAFRDILEHMVSQWSPVEGGGARFAQISGLQIYFDSMAIDRRVRDARLMDGETPGDALIVDGVVQDPSATIRVVVPGRLSPADMPLGVADYALGAGSVTRMPLRMLGSPAVDELTYAEFYTDLDALAEYIRANFPSPALALVIDETPPTEDLRIQNAAHRTSTF